MKSVFMNSWLCGKFVMKIKQKNMKRTLLISAIAILATLTTIKAQIVTIPDVNFKAYLVANASINTNMDTEIQVSEATAYTGAINSDNLAIFDFTGISAFVNLTFLGCGQNSMTSLDLSSNIALTFVS